MSLPLFCECKASEKMMKKPNNIFNFILFIGCIFITPSLLGQDIENNSDIALADSLFLQQEYIESFEIYENYVKSNRSTTPQMMLKMAFIKEGLGSYGDALLYLNRYYLLTADKRAIHKMEEIAQEHNLEGYKSTDLEFFKGLINRNYLLFNLIIFTLIAFLLGIITYRRYVSKSSVLPYGVILILLLVGFFFLTNFPLKNKNGVIINDNTYLMTGPSSGADLVEIVKKGHRVKILDRGELWFKVEWRDQEAYIRNNRIRPII